MNYSFLLILIFPIISANEQIFSSQESSSIFPLQLGKLYETNNTSTKACLFLFFDDLKLVDLHNIKVPYLGRTLSVCPGEESALFLDTIKIDVFTFTVSENETISLHYNSEGEEQILDFECSDEEEKAFWKKNYMKYCVLGKMRNGSDKFTKNAHNNDDEIIIITSRKYTDQDTKLGKLMRYTVEQWLKHNGIETDKIIYCNGQLLFLLFVLCLQHSLIVI